jgi:hypothetical protein
MAGNTVSGSLSHAVDIGTGSYFGLLTITNTGTVAPIVAASYNAAIIFNDTAGSGTVDNMGTLLGGYDDGAANGGAGIAFISGTGLVINSSTIIGNGSQIDPAAGNGGDGVFERGFLDLNARRGDGDQPDGCRPLFLSRHADFDRAGECCR